MFDAMRAAHRFADLARDALERGAGEAYVIALMDLRAALDRLPGDPV